MLTQLQTPLLGHRASTAIKGKDRKVYPTDTGDPSRKMQPVPARGPSDKHSALWQDASQATELLGYTRGNLLLSLADHTSNNLNSINSGSH